MDVLLVRAANPSPYTLSGTNTWVVGRDPAWVVDPGPALDEHLDAVAAEVSRRGGAGGVALTHDHPDHADGLPGLLGRLGHPPVGAMPPLADGDSFGPFTALHVPGHAQNHLVFVAGRAAFTGDVVLGEGSVFIDPDGGSLRGYLEGLRRLRDLGLARIHPGHGPEVADPGERLERQIVHRLEREQRIVAALECGARTEAELLAAAWDHVPDGLAAAAAATLRSHLAKLEDEGRLP